MIHFPHLRRTEEQEAARAQILAHAQRLQHEEQAVLPTKRKRVIGKGRGNTVISINFVTSITFCYICWFILLFVTFVILFLNIRDHVTRGYRFSN